MEQYAYADDLLFIIREDQVEETISKLKEVSQRFRLILNCKKSGLLRVKNTYRAGEVLGIPFVDKYSYLGVTLDNGGSLKTHRKVIKSRVAMIGQ